MNDALPLAALTVVVAIMAVFWVLYLIRIVQQDDQVKEYHRAVRRQQEELRRAEEDEEKEKSGGRSTLKKLSQDLPTRAADDT